jgi:hypothetical protein
VRDRLDRDRVVERGEVVEPGERLKARLVEDRRCREASAAVDDPVADGIDGARAC